MPHILLVDDDVLLGQSVQRYLLSLGYEVSWAQDGLEGALQFAKTPFDLVITDIFMPGHEGLELIRTLQKASPATPIIAMSGGGARLLFEDQTRNIERFKDVALAFGAVRFIEKPYSLKALAALVSSSLVPVAA